MSAVEIRYDGGSVKGKVVAIFTAGAWKPIEDAQPDTLLAARLTRDVGAVRVRTLGNPWSSPDEGAVTATYTEVLASAITAVLYSRKENNDGA